MSTAIIIPARFNSSRFPGKPLAKILGKEMILRVLDICKKSINKNKIFVATDDQRIKKVVEKNKFKVLLTSRKCKTGTDRVAEASFKVKAKIIVNVQGDEPLINYKDILKIISAKKKFPNHIICGYTDIGKKENPKNINIPKVVLSRKSDLIYISRKAIPGTKEKNKRIIFNKQVCIYAFSKSELNIFRKYGKISELEKLEDIEILRFFEIGKPIKMVRLSKTTLAVDKKSDIKLVEKFLKKKK